MYKFIKDRDGSRVEFTCHQDSTWPDLMDEFVRFLQSSGYSIEGETLIEWAENASIPHKLIYDREDYEKQREEI